MNASDPFDPKQVIQFGKDRDTCMDSRDHRATTIVGEDSATFTVANFRHGRQWWLAVIPKTGIDRVFFQISVFKDYSRLIGTGHAQIRFTMKSGTPILLHQQRLGKPYQVITISDFVMTAEPYYSVRGDPGKFGGLTGQMGIALQMISGVERTVDEVALKIYHRVMQAELNLDEKQKAHLLEVAVRRADRLGYSSIFDIFSSNCVTFAFDILDEAFPPPKGARSSRVNLGDIVSLNIVIQPVQEALVERRLTRRGDITLLNDETADGELALDPMINAMEDSPEREQLKALRDKTTR